MAHPWSWLSPRHFVRLRAGRSSAQRASRPCLPTFETLDDRILLSAAPAATAGGPVPPATFLVAEIDGVIGQPGNTAALLGLELGTYKLTGQDAAGLKIDAQLTDQFLKIDNLFSEADTDFIKGGFTLDRQYKMQTALTASFLKLDEIVQGGTGITPKSEVGDGGDMLPAVQNVEQQATALENKLDGLAPGSGASLKNEVVLIALNDAFTNLEGNLLKIGSDVARNDVGLNVAINYVELKLNEAFIKIATPPDSALKADLAGAQTEVDSLLIGLLNPAPVGVTTVGGTGANPT